MNQAKKEFFRVANTIKKYNKPKRYKKLCRICGKTFEIVADHFIIDYSCDSCNKELFK